MVANVTVCAYGNGKDWSGYPGPSRSVGNGLMGTAGLPAGDCKGLTASGMHLVNAR